MANFGAGTLNFKKENSRINRRMATLHLDK